MLIYRTVNAQGVNFDLNTSGFLTETIATLNNLVTELFPLIALILGFLLAIWIVTEIIAMFKPTIYLDNDNKIDQISLKPETNKKIKKDDFAHYEEEEEFPDDWQDRPDWLKR